MTEAPDSPYAEVGPVFVHADTCAGYSETGSYPADFRHRRQVFRSYSGAGDMLEAVVTTGADAERTLTELLADERAAVVHSRNIEAGCYMFAVRRG